MGWFTKFLTSSIGQKFVMAGTGLFLMLFLVVHLIGNLSLLKDDGGEAFNTYAYFMTSFPPIKIISYLLYTFIILHTIQGLSLWRQNKAAAGTTRYAVEKSRPSERSSRNMAWLGIVIFIFLVLHMYQFWVQMHWGKLAAVDVEAYPHPVKDLYSLVAETYKSGAYVLFYVICMAVVGFHLWHGFWSSFQTLGLDHKKYTPVIKFIGYVYSIGVPVGFAIIPLVRYFLMN